MGAADEPHSNADTIASAVTNAVTLTFAGAVANGHTSACCNTRAVPNSQHLARRG